MVGSDTIGPLFEQLRNLAHRSEGVEIGRQILAQSQLLNSPDTLIYYLHDVHWQIRYYAAMALGNFEQPEVARNLIEQFKQDDNKEVQAEIVISLRYPKTLLALQTLLEIAKDPRYPTYVRSMAVESIGVSINRNVIDTLFELVTKPSGRHSSQVTDSVFSAFEEVDEGILKRLITLLAARSLPDYSSIQAIVYLGQRRYTQAVDAVLVLLDDADPTFRQAATDALGQIGDARILPKLTSMRDNPNEFVRTAVATAIQQLQGNNSNNN